MKITKLDLTVGKVVGGYTGDKTKGLSACDGKCKLSSVGEECPSYNDKLRGGVIRSLLSGFPVGTMYVISRLDKGWQVVDGRRRVHAMCEFANGSFEFDGRTFTQLDDTERERFLGTQLDAYLCEGEISEVEEWLARTNVHNQKTDLPWVRDAVYSSNWLDDALVRFSQMNGLEHIFGDVPVRDQVSSTIAWAAQREDISVEQYMSEHMGDDDASGLERYLERVVPWVNSLFGSVHADVMAGVPWGEYYNDYGREQFNPSEVMSEMERLLKDDSVTNKQGVFDYLLCGDISSLKLRKFTDGETRSLLEKQGGYCAHCGCEVDAKDARISCVKPWPNGPVSVDNAEVLCKKCDRDKKNRAVSVFG